MFVMVFTCVRECMPNTKMEQYHATNLIKKRKRAFGTLTVFCFTELEMKLEIAKNFSTSHTKMVKDNNKNVIRIKTKFGQP